MFETFYSSFYQHPLLLWAVPLVFVFFIPRRSDFFALYLWVFSVLTICDALMTGPGAEWLGLSDSMAEGVAIFFVILGDARFFLVIEHFSGTRSQPPQPGTLRPYLTALAWSFVVPVGQLALLRAFPALFLEARHTFLAYEILFFLLALWFRVVLLPRRRRMSAASARWLGQVCGYAMAYYACWILADVVILAGTHLTPGIRDVGFALRVIPNVLYYGFFLPFVFWRAPLEWKGTERGFSTGRLSAQS